jgi:ATP-dependent RNA helicase RhlE
LPFSACRPNSPALSTIKATASPHPSRRRPFPVILAGRDVLAGAQTGTGKTAGFTLPLLQRLATQRGAGRRHRRSVRPCGR